MVLRNWVILIVSAIIGILALFVASGATDPTAYDVGLFVFVLAIALIGLFLSLTRHLRIVDRRARQLEEQDASAAEVDPEPGAEGGVVPPAPDDEPGGR